MLLPLLPLSLSLSILFYSMLFYAMLYLDLLPYPTLPYLTLLPTPQYPPSQKKKGTDRQTDPSSKAPSSKLQTPSNFQEKDQKIKKSNPIPLNPIKYTKHINTHTHTHTHNLKTFFFKKRRAKYSKKNQKPGGPCKTYLPYTNRKRKKKKKKKGQMGCENVLQNE